MSDFNILDFGAISDGSTDNAASIQKAIDTATTAGGGRVIVPAGKPFMTGTLTLKSNVELHVERGGTLLGSPNWEDYGYHRKVSALGAGSVNDKGLSMLITADGAENIAITGGGVIDGNGRSFVEEDLGYIYKMKYNRPFTFFLLGCHNVLMENVIVRDGALWTVRMSGCEDVTIHAIHIQNDLKLPNNDGIDLDRCRNVRISDCNIVSGDDCICLKTCQETEGYGPCENVTVTGCTLVSTSSALIIGAEAREPMRNIVFDSCVIRSSHRGLAIHLSEESDIENVLFSNMIVETRIFHEAWWGRGEPIYITAIPWTNEHKIGHVRNIRFSNILCRGENGVVVEGWEPGLIQNILFDGVRVELDKWSKWPGGRFDLRPTPGEPLPAHSTAGFYMRNASGVTLRNCEVAWGANPPDYFQYALEAHNIDGLTLENFKGSHAHPQQSTAILRD
jgi:Glycosyl hydrolases family 28